MGIDRRDGAGGQAQVRRIPAPPTAQTNVETPKNQSTLPKNRGPSPQRRTPAPSARAKDASSILCSPAASNKRHEQTPSTKISKTLLRRSPPQAIEKDDVPERDSSQKPTARRETSSRDSGHRRPTSESSSSTVNGKNIVKQLSALVKSTRANPSGASSSGTSASKPAPAAAPAPAPAPAVAPRQPTRSASVCRDRMAERLPGDTRSSMLRRSASVGKGRAASSQSDFMPEHAGAKSRPVIARTGSASAVQPPVRPPMRDASAGRLRPASASVKGDVSLHSSSKLTTITEAPSRPPVPAAIAAAALQARPSSTPSRPVLPLNLAALKQQVVPPLLSAASAASADPGSRTSTEESGPPVPKLDLGGILQRRAEEQASEPVFVVAASTEDELPPPSMASQSSLVDNKRKSITQLPSAKEEPAEHFYLYPKVNPQEKKRIEDICKVVPKRQQVAITDLFSKMVEARQNCEQMCFRGHRLLDQAQAEFKNRLAQKEEEVAQTKEEAMQWRQEAEFLRAQLALLLGARQPEEYMDEYSPAPGHSERQQEEGEGSATSDLRNSFMSAFDRIGLLGSAGAGMAYSNDVQEYADG
ncbi:hypothetical protein Agub_g3327 [Astrephomene gubernaculifera]|uniref:Uncharacterized protein n=1 Tax=Astrephomene gubernaculifera TaxID=47775 RepID=A0AAD3HIZ4_9CHLO|nr:hypothetical protein Agub_g3327 [Astrephomene gubernaculifera]